MSRESKVMVSRPCFTVVKEGFAEILQISEQRGPWMTYTPRRAHPWDIRHVACTHRPPCRSIWGRRKARFAEQAEIGSREGWLVDTNNRLALVELARPLSLEVSSDQDADSEKRMTNPGGPAVAR